MSKPKPEQEPQTGRFLAGNSGNGGRKKGSRNKLAQAFIDALYIDLQEHGADTIRRVREERPAVYLRVIASILPQKVELERYDHLSDEERLDRIRELAEQLGLAGLLAG